ncbi:hypothetical protein ACOMHN_019705 [Nucella lapillus]
MPRAAAGKAGAKKGRGPKAHKLPERFPIGEILNQTLFKKKWQLGDVIGQGGFGLIYKAYDVTDGPANQSQPFVIKINEFSRRVVTNSDYLVCQEPQDNGPLFCELHFYQRVAKPESVSEWSKMKKLRYLAVPLYLGSGQHKKGDKVYRFIVLQHLGTDLQKVFEQNGRCFSEKTAYSIGRRVLDALEYIHDKGYCHADIKAANILLGHSGGKTDFNQVYLVDYGLAYRFLVDGAQKPYKEDPKRAHDGTAEYASRDAHKGVYPSRRGDLEILGYCMLEWLAGGLPWSKAVSDKDRVRDLKIKHMNDLPDFFKACFGSRPCPEGLKKYLAIVSKLAYDEKPDYNQLRQFLRSGGNNEWALGMTDGASPTKGMKRKSESSGPPTPRKKGRPSSSPVAQRQPAAKGSATAAATSTSQPALVNGSSKPSTPRAKPSTPRAKPSTPRAKAKTAASAKTRAGKSPRAAKVSASKAQIIPGAARGKTGMAKVVRSPSKVKSPGAGKARKQTPKSKSAVTSPVSSRPSSATKGKARSVQMRKRTRMVVSSDTAVQTSPGLGLRQNAV